MAMADSVTLRPREDRDLDALYSLAAELDSWELRGPSAPTALTRSAWDAQRTERDANSDSSNTQFVIDVDGQPVGYVVLFGFDHLARHAEIGIALLADFRGQGVGTAALQQIVEFAFVRSNLRRLHLEAIASNVGGLRAYERVGFREEGRQREHVWVRGRYEDLVMMGLLRSEWRAAHPDPTSH